MFAQESEVQINYEGKDFNKLKHTWEAQWITHPTASTLDYGVFNFRRSFTLDKQPEKFIIYVSADNRYRLFVNGKQVCFGPSLGDISNYRYETIDIAKYLNSGENAITAEVVNFGEYRRAAQQTFQTAFILQAEPYEETHINTGERGWKVSKNEAYHSIPFTSDSLHAYYAAGPGERRTDSIYPWGWQEIDFDDSHWPDPKPGTVEFAVGRGFLYGSTWFLVPREIPFMEEKPERFSKIARSEGIKIKEEKSFVSGEKALRIPAHSKVSILFDQDHHTTGFPELKYSKGKGAGIKITYAEALYKKRNTDSKVAHFDISDLKGNRNILEGKEIQGYYDLLFPDGGEKRSFKPLSRKTYRFIQLDIETKEEDLLIDDFYGVYTAYPFEEKAKFETTDPLLTKIWEMSWRTLRNSAGESFFDPYYEQLQYIGDTKIEALISIYVSGDDRLMRKALKQFDESRIPEGLTQSRYPSYIVQVIPPYSLIWVNMVHDYYMYRDDPQFLKQFLPGIRGVLEWFAAKVDDTGMPTGLEWWNFTDWSPGFQNGIPPGADNGYSADISLQYVMALENAIDLFRYFGWDYEVKRYSDLADQVKQSVVKHCFDDSKGMFAETPEKKIFSQHTNIFAILTNTVGEDDKKPLMNEILETPGLIKASIYFRFYLFRALQEAGMGNLYTEMLQPWKNMIDKGMTTFGETDINPRSECHAWSASPCFDLLHTVAGIYPAEPGFKSVIIEPQFGTLDKLNVSFPHPKGQIKLVLEKKKNNREVLGTITFPPDLTGVFRWESKEVKLQPGTQTIKIKQ